MPHLLTSLLTKVAVTVIEGLLVRLLAQLWNAYIRGGRPTAATA
ncbi:hypothetical protein [Streptomyces halobius]|nr:hypothetical protein [Streptomyces halobius]